MAYYKVHGIVLREANYKESDKILTVLTREAGLISLKARGVRRNSSDLKSACQLLAYSEFTYSEIKGFNTVTEAAAIDMFTGLRNEIEAMTLGFYFSQVSELIAQQDMPDRRMLSVLLNSLYALSRKLYPLGRVKACFEVKAAVLAGYEPQLAGCCTCGTADCSYFNVSLGGIQCGNCAIVSSEGIRIPINQGVINALKYIICSDEKRFLSFKLDDGSEKAFESVAETYLLVQLEQSFSSLNMYKSLTVKNGF